MIKLHISHGWYKILKSFYHTLHYLIATSVVFVKKTSVELTSDRSAIFVLTWKAGNKATQEKTCLLP